MRPLMMSLMNRQRLTKTTWTWKTYHHPSWKLNLPRAPTTNRHINPTTGVRKVTHRDRLPTRLQHLWDQVDELWDPPGDGHCGFHAFWHARQQQDFRTAKTVIEVRRMIRTKAKSLRRASVTGFTQHQKYLAEIFRGSINTWDDALDRIYNKAADEAGHYSACLQHVEAFFDGVYHTPILAALYKCNIWIHDPGQSTDCPQTILFYYNTETKAVGRILANGEFKTPAQIMATETIPYARSTVCLIMDPGEEKDYPTLTEGAEDAQAYHGRGHVYLAKFQEADMAPPTEAKKSTPNTKQGPPPHPHPNYTNHNSQEQHCPWQHPHGSQPHHQTGGQCIPSTIGPIDNTWPAVPTTGRHCHTRRLRGVYTSEQEPPKEPHYFI